MKILFYCQHVLGIGHYFRSLEICKAFKEHQVSLVLGGPDIDLPLPEHITPFKLPGLMMDHDFSAIMPVEKGRDIAEIKKERQELILQHFQDLQPDIVILELYPFGRKAFRFELEPLLAAINGRQDCLVACSLRDILVEKSKKEVFEQRVVKSLNNSFDLLLVHADHNFINLADTFSSLHKISIPVHYTGFVSQQAPPISSSKEDLRINKNDKLIVASAGGGSVGFTLLKSAAKASKILQNTCPHTMILFTGPYMASEEFKTLQNLAHPGLVIKRFTTRFMTYLQAADLSISMAGYNTSMNILATKVCAMVWPFAQNQEQLMRAEALGPEIMTILRDSDLQPDQLAQKIHSKFSDNQQPWPHIDIAGAQNTAKILIGALNN